MSGWFVRGGGVVLMIWIFCIQNILLEKVWALCCILGLAYGLIEICRLKEDVDGPA